MVSTYLGSALTASALHKLSFYPIVDLCGRKLVSDGNFSPVRDALLTVKYIAHVGRYP
jgi:hypothetical protein